MKRYKIAVLDDYQNAAVESADWSVLRVDAGYLSRGSTRSSQPTLVPLAYRAMLNLRRSTARSRCTWQNTSVAGALP